MRMLREAGFQLAAKVSTRRQPGIFATLDAGAPRTLGLYYMYDVKQGRSRRMVFAAIRSRSGVINPASEKSSWAARRKSERSEASFSRRAARNHGAGNKSP